MSVDHSDKLLLVDAGNTRVKWVLVAGSDEVSALSADQQQAEAYAETESPQQGMLRITERLLTSHQPARLVLVHVLGAALTRSLDALCARLDCQLLVVDAQQNSFGIKSAYTNPAHLGADRLVALVAARFMAGTQPALVIDCGTAVTVDALEPDGQHPGGLILPGLGLLSDSLIRRTQAKHMAMSDFERPVLFAQDTARGIGSGCLFSLVGAIEGICRRMHNDIYNKLSAQPVRIICGGDAALIHTHLDGNYRLEPALVMTGLWLIAEHY